MEGGVMQIELRQDVHNSLWYVWIDSRRLSPQGFKFENEAQLFGQGYREGWTAARKEAQDLLQGMESVV
jgi:hypothetical protein